jgi:excisionase family DNA binding protein
MLNSMGTATARNLDDLIRRMTPVSAPVEERADVTKLSHALRGLARAQRRRRGPLCQLVGPKGEAIAVPEAVFRVLERVVEVLAHGDAITVVPVGKELTTQQAADLLNVSRQYLVRLLDEGRILHTKTGKHRRLRVEDVLAFRSARDSERDASLRALTELTEELGGYEREMK